MADDEGKELLRKWNLEKYIKTFEDNEVVGSVFSGLTDQMIAQLIKPIGDQARFKIKVKTLSEDRNNRILKANLKREAPCSSDTLKKRQKCHSNDAENIDFNNLDINEDLYVNNSIISKHFNSVRNIIKKSEKGKNIISRYEKSNKLSHKDRTFIVAVLIDELRSITKSIDYNIFGDIGAKIVEAFPSEILSTYFIPGIKAKDTANKKSVSARGKLMNKWRNEITASKTSEDVVEVRKESNLSISLDADVKESLTWLNLNANTALKDVALYHWKKTAAYRLHTFSLNREKNLIAVFETWPILDNPSAHDLIQYDFEFLEKTIVVAAADTWNIFYETVRNVDENSLKNEKAVYLQNLLELESLSDDSRVIIQLLLLAHIVPSKATFKIKVDKKFKTVKIGIGDTKNSMVQLATTISEVEVVREKRRKQAIDNKLTLQPYIIIVGEDLTKLTHFFVCLDKVLYSVDSSINAVDLCFKVFHVFNLLYPIESKHLWLLIQKCYYTFDTKFDEQLSYTEHIIAALRASDQKKASQEMLRHDSNEELDDNKSLNSENLISE